MQDRFDVVVIGAGAAGIAAAGELARAGRSVLALEARDRIGERARTPLAGPGLPIDLGCGWVHSADRNPLAPLIEQAGFTLDRTPPAWGRQAGNQNFPAEDQAAFARAYDDFEARLEAAAGAPEDRPAADFFEAGGRWNMLMDAVSTYYNGAEYACVSVKDYAAYDDSGVNWRVAEGYGKAIASFADRSLVTRLCPASLVDWGGREIRIETSRGALHARAVVVTVPTPHVAAERLAFSPALPDKIEAAGGLPLGLADKAFLRLAEPDALPADQHLFGRTDMAETGSYHLRPFGRPYVEAYLGGRLARSLEGDGPGGMAAFAIEELVGLLGSGFRSKVARLTETAWTSDPWSLGAYSHALPGCAGSRRVLAQPVEGRLFFAGEATSPHAFSTAHGAWESGLRAASEVIAALSAQAA